MTRFITSRIVLVLELISDFLGITLHHWPARGVNYSRAELHYISRPVGELINNSITFGLDLGRFWGRFEDCYRCLVDVSMWWSIWEGFGLDFGN